jgi:hypothetical protein
LEFEIKKQKFIAEHEHSHALLNWYNGKHLFAPEYLARLHSIEPENQAR